MASIMNSLALVLLVISQLYYGMGATVAVDGKFSSLASEGKPEVHIVYMGGVSETTTTNDLNVHLQIVSNALGSVDAAANSILYSYRKSFNGFAAILTETQAAKIRGLDEVVSVFKSQINQHHTTASWEFLGLSSTEGLWPTSNFGNGSIVGMIDTGVWPEAQSFSDDGFGPIPSGWKGKCVKGVRFSSKNCNKKLIGARYFVKGYEAQNGPIIKPDIKSPRDTIGHGTHTASTATGRQVANASFQGLANGTASGGAPFARLAVYKVCWGGGFCTDADLLAAFEAAITDGVGLLSISIGFFTARDFQKDSIAIGAFHAIEKGIVVSCSAGNSGSEQGSVTNSAPWILTVAASTINRVFQSTVQLESGPPVPGIAINTKTMNSTYPIVYGGDIPAVNASVRNAASCNFGSLDPAQVKGKIVVCAQDPEGFEDPPESIIITLNGVGLVYITDEDQTIDPPTLLPHTNVDPKSGDVILGFLNSTSNAAAFIFPSVAAFNTTPAPIIAFFSSVGPPNLNFSDYLKPDITAPGVNILAAWPRGVEGVDGDFNIISGTSMACPHVTGAAALVKSVHPDWSPAAIKSAILTTATPLNKSIPGNYELASGAGMINPTKAVDPGLIFNTTTTDYTNFLCTYGYNVSAIRLVTGLNVTCPETPPAVVDMNYPSISISSNLTAGMVRTITRTVTNVAGGGSAEYVATVVAPPDLGIQVVPSSLSFSGLLYQELSFTVTLTAHQVTNESFGSITWNDSPNSHSVRMVVGIAPLRFREG